MKIIDSARNKIATALFKGVSDTEVFNAFKKRFYDPRETKKASDGIIPYFTPQRVISLQEYQSSVDLADNPHTRSRYLYYKMSANAMLDLHLTSIWETRILECQGTKFILKDAGDKEDEGAKQIFGLWFTDFIKYAIESIREGYSLVELWDLTPDAKIIKMNSGTKAVYSYKEATLIPRANVRPEYEMWTPNTFDLRDMGISYTDPLSAPFYIPIGKKDDLGMMRKLAPIALAKRHALGAWGDFDEKLGIPFRKVTMAGNDKRRESYLAQIMEKMGSAGWGIFHPGEVIELIQANGSDVHKCFLEIINLCDKQMSKATLGSTMVVDAEGGQYKGDVHQQTVEIRYQADKMFIQYLVNDMLLPRMIKRGMPLEGYRFEIDDSKELSLTDQIKIDIVLLQYYDIDPKYISNKYDVPLDMIKNKSAGNVEDLLNESIKKKDPAKPLKETIIPKEAVPAQKKKVTNEYSTTIINSVDKIYYPKNCCTPEVVNAATEGYNMIADVIKRLYDGRLKPTDLHEGLYKWQVDQLLKAAEEGYDKNLGGFKYNETDPQIVTNIKANIYVFSAFKNYQELRAMSDMLIDADGKPKQYNQFKKDVLAVHDTYDKRFLRAEYDHAMVSAQAVTMWQRFESEKGRFGMLRYNAIMDGGTTQLCASINGTTLPVDDPFWNIYMIPNHWGERSTIDQVSSGSVPKTENPEMPDVPKMFENNIGKTGTVFHENHPYFQTNKDTASALKTFADKQFKSKE